MAKFVNDRNIRFMMNEVLDINQLTRYPYFSEHNDKVFQMVVDAALKLADKELYPLLREMDQKQPLFENGTVKVHPMVKKLMTAYGQGGWISAGFPEVHDGDQLPVSITAISRFIFAAANYSASVYPELSAGAAQLITTFGSQALIDTYVPSMLEGRWQGTMALTEPQAGSSLSDITTTAFPISASLSQGSEAVSEKAPQDSPNPIQDNASSHQDRESAPLLDGVYKIKGQKTFISAGDHDGVENIVHLMLARIDGAPSGIKGISLFVVPKNRLDASGKLIPNDVKTAGIYHKLGYRGAPITELAIGDNDDCLGWLVGEPGRGLIQMFQMMNEARLGVGLGATAIASAAYHAALAYASERPQGRPMDGGKKNKPKGRAIQEGKESENAKTDEDKQIDKKLSIPQIPIIHHADVKRMLLFQKAMVEGSFSLILQCCLYADLEQVTVGEEKKKYALLLDLLTPVAKSWPSEQGIHSVSQAIQCFGGYGYCEDFPIEQYFRDARIHPIHEGTTGIQGMDLLGRKLMMENGKAARLFMEEVQKSIHNADLTCQKSKAKHHASESGYHEKSLEFSVKKLSEALALMNETGNHLFGVAQKKGGACFLADATLFLEFFGIAAIAWQWLIQGTVAIEALSQMDPHPQVNEDNLGNGGAFNGRYDGTEKKQKGKHSKKTEKERCFYEGKLYTMNYFFRYELPKMKTLATRLTDGDDLTVTMPKEFFI